MTQHLEFSWTYATTPLDMFRMVTRLEHLEEKAAFLGHRNHKMLELRERNGAFRSITQRQVDVDLPGWAPKFITPRNLITQTQIWGPPANDGSRRYSANVEIGGLPVTITGEGALISMQYTATRYDIWLDVRSSLPLVGRRAERFVAEQLASAIHGEHEFRLLWLQRRSQQRAFY
jgi:hypothetical protein